MTLVAIGQQCQSIENDRSSLSVRPDWKDLASANHAVFHHETTVRAVSAADLENCSKIKYCEVPFCSCDETLNLLPGGGMTFAFTEAETR